MRVFYQKALEKDVHELDIDPPACTCSTCVSYCSRPGWFSPDQIPSLIKFLGKPLHALLGNKLAIDYWQSSPSNVYVLAPNLVGNKSIMYPSYPYGKCAFLKKKRCLIHQVRPLECRKVHHSQQTNDWHARIMIQWKDRQELLENFIRQNQPDEK